MARITTRARAIMPPIIHPVAEPLEGCSTGAEDVAGGAAGLVVGTGACEVVAGGAVVVAGAGAAAVPGVVTDTILDGSE